MEREVKVATQENAAQVQAQTSAEITPARVALVTRLFCLWPLAQGQYDRGDLLAARTTAQEIDALLDANQDAFDWVELQVQNLRSEEAGAQWDLADASLAKLQARLEKGEIAPPDALPKDPRAVRPSAKELAAQLEMAQLAGLNVLAHPEKFSLELRQQALERVVPRLNRFVVTNPQSQGRALVALARAQLSLGAKEWRASLQSAQDSTLADATRQGRWSGLVPVAQEWRAGGETERAQSLGRQVLKLWKVDPRPKNRGGLVSLLLECGLLDEATQLLTPRPKIDAFSWHSELTDVARARRVAPPQELLKLAPVERHGALVAWANGLAPMEESRPGRGSESNSLLTPLF